MNQQRWRLPPEQPWPERVFFLLLSVSPTSPLLYCNHNAIALQISKYFSFIGISMVEIKEATRNISFCTHKTGEAVNPKETKSPVCADAEAAPYASNPN
jgi:hypothetical protein